LVGSVSNVRILNCDRIASGSHLEKACRVDVVVQ
jgi:hypothetical protein